MIYWLLKVFFYILLRFRGIWFMRSCDCRDCRDWHNLPQVIMLLNTKYTHEHYSSQRCANFIITNIKGLDPSAKKNVEENKQETIIDPAHPWLAPRGTNIEIKSKRLDDAIPVMWHEHNINKRTNIYICYIYIYTYSPVFIIYMKTYSPARTSTVNKHYMCCGEKYNKIDISDSIQDWIFVSTQF